MKTLLGEGWWSFITRGRLKDGGVHKLLLILGAALIGEKRLKEGERLLEDLPYIYIYCFSINFYSCLITKIT